MSVKDVNLGMGSSTMESILSLNDGRRARPAEQPFTQFDSDHFLSGIIRQPSPPPVLARVQPEHSSISPSRVADARPGPSKSFSDDTPSSNVYQHLHIPTWYLSPFRSWWS